MAILTTQRPTIAGTTITPVAAAAGGDSFQNDGDTSFRVVNGSGAPITVTFVSPNTCSFGFATGHDLVVTVAAGATKEYGAFSQARFNDTNGRVQVTYSAVTTVTVAACAL